MNTILDKNFYKQNTLDIAKNLLGKCLVKKNGNSIISGYIVETEAYLGMADKASHAYGGKRTNRNEAMYGNAGSVYVFQIYGMYFCFNIATEEINIPTAVLIRAIEPLAGLEAMALNRYKKELRCLSKIELKNLTNGPGKLCKAYNIDKSSNFIDLCESTELFVTNSDKINFEICSTPRIGINYAEEYIEKPWRFFIKDNMYVSKK